MGWESPSSANASRLMPSGRFAFGSFACSLARTVHFQGQLPFRQHASVQPAGAKFDASCLRRPRLLSRQEASCCPAGRVLRTHVRHSYWIVFMTRGKIRSQARRSYLLLRLGITSKAVAARAGALQPQNVLDIRHGGCQPSLGCKRWFCRGSLLCQLASRLSMPLPVIAAVGVPPPLSWRLRAR